MLLGSGYSFSPRAWQVQRIWQIPEFCSRRLWYNLIILLLGTHAPEAGAASGHILDAFLDDSEDEMALVAAAPVAAEGVCKKRRLFYSRIPTHERKSLRLEHPVWLPSRALKVALRTFGFLLQVSLG